MKIDEYNLLIEKAKTRKDGVYAFRDYFYVVKDNQFIAFADPYGECFQCMGIFKTRVNIGLTDRYNRKAKLTEWLKLKQ